MSPRTIVLNTLAVSLFSLFGPAAAIDDPRTESSAKNGPNRSPMQLSSEEVARLIKQLDANEFAAREAASKSLLEAGKATIAALAAAATGQSLEVSMRAIAILRRHILEGDAATKAAARLALEKIAKCDKPAVAAAAQESLKTKPAEPTQFPGLPAGIQVDPGQFQFQVGGAVGPRSRRFSMRNSNGVKEIEVQEDNRTVKIHDDPASGIKMEITEKKDGKGEAKNYEAKNTDELKQKHPEAFKLYEEYSKQPQGFQVFGGNLPVEGLIPVGPQLPRPFLRFGIGREVADQLDHAQKQLEEATKLIKKQLNNAGRADDLAKALEQLEEAKRQLDEARAKLRG